MQLGALESEALGVQVIASVREVAGGSQILHTATGQCLTALEAPGDSVGLDKGVTVTAAQLKPCVADGDASQTFSLTNYDKQGFPGDFPVRTLPDAPGGGELCLQPQIKRTPHFTAVAFQAPDGAISVVVMNVGESEIEFNLIDMQAKRGLRRVAIPPHAIHTYRWAGAPPSDTDHLGDATLSAAPPTLVGTINIMPERSGGPYGTWLLSLLGVVTLGVAGGASMLRRAAGYTASAVADGDKWAAAETSIDYDEYVENTP